MTTKFQKLITILYVRAGNLTLMNTKEVIVIRPGRVRYVDLAVHDNASRSDFFNAAGLKTLSWHGLIMETEELVKVWHNDDETDDSEGAGIVIPRECVLDIMYFVEDYSDLAPRVDGMKEKN